MGAVKEPAQLHAWEDPEKRFESCVLCQPNRPVRDIVGKYKARAAPIKAFAAIRSCSACRISGRRVRG